MRYVTFHGEQISRLGFGFMRLPVHNGDQSQVDYGKAEEMVLYALENGVNYYDTAYPYHNGHSEMTLGRILAENRIRDQVKIATKLFTLGMDKPDYSPQRML